MRTGGPDGPGHDVQRTGLAMGAPLAASGCFAGVIEAFHPVLNHRALLLLSKAVYGYPEPFRTMLKRNSFLTFRIARCQAPDTVCNNL